MPIVIAVDSQRPECSEDGRGRTDDGPGAGGVDKDVARKPGDEVDEQVFCPAGEDLEVGAGDIEGPHVEQDVKQVGMQEHGREQAPVLVVDGDVRRIHGAPLIQGPAEAAHEPATAAGGDLQDKHGDVDADEHARHWIAGRAEQTAALPAGSRLLPGDHARPPLGAAVATRNSPAAGNGAQATALLGHTVRAAKADRRRRHALVADGLAAVGARHASLPVWMPVAAADVHVVWHMQVEIFDHVLRGRRAGVAVTRLVGVLVVAHLAVPTIPAASS